MNKHIFESQWQDCYNLYDTSKHEYIGTIKVPLKSGVMKRIKRANKMLPFTKKMEYLTDYTMEFVGSFKKEC